MIVLARGSITKPEGLAAYIEDEMRVVAELKAAGVLKASYVPGAQVISHRFPSGSAMYPE